MKQILQNVANSLGYQISKVREPVQFPWINVLELVLDDYMKRMPDPFFIQIGANDGETADPIHQLIRKYNLKGILIEPQPQMFQRLLVNYQQQPQLIFENIAIAAQDGDTTFYLL